MKVKCPYCLEMVNIKLIVATAIGDSSKKDGLESQETWTCNTCNKSFYVSQVGSFTTGNEPIKTD